MPQSFMQRHYFLLRRLHSLTGIVPIGLFMIVHLITNSSVVWGHINTPKLLTEHAHKLDAAGITTIHGGAATFQHEVNFIHSLPFLILMEVMVLWIPIAFHAGLGIYFATTGRSNVKHYKWGGNWRYVLQRVTAWIGLVYLVYHIGTLRWGWTKLIPGQMKWEAEHAGSTMAAALQGSTESITILGLVVIAFYLLGVTSLAFHFANGLWTAAITWGITISESAQKRWGYACAALGVFLTAAGWAAVIGFAGLDYNEARSAELIVNNQVDTSTVPSPLASDSESELDGNANMSAVHSVPAGLSPSTSEIQH